MGRPNFPWYGYTDIGSALEEHDKVEKKIKAGIATSKDIEIFENSTAYVVEYYKKEHEKDAD